MTFDPLAVGALFQKHDPGYKHEYKDGMEYTWSSSNKVVWLQISPKEGRIYFSVTFPEIDEPVESWDSYLTNENISEASKILSLYLGHTGNFYVATIPKKRKFLSTSKKVPLVKIGNDFFDISNGNLRNAARRSPQKIDEKTHLEYIPRA